MVLLLCCGSGRRSGVLLLLFLQQSADLVHQLGQHGQGAVNGVGAVGQLDGAHAAVLHHQKSHRLDVDARAGAAAEQVLVGGVLAVKVGVAFPLDTDKTAFIERLREAFVAMTFEDFVERTATDFGLDGKKAALVPAGRQGR